MKKTLSDEELNRLKNECREELSLVRQQLLVMHPFCGAAAMRFELTPVRDLRCQTACTDMKNVYFSISFLSKLTRNERIFVLAHEIWHALNLSFFRKMNRDVFVWNCATDMEINNILSDKESGCGLNPPPNLLFPPNHLKNENAETIYEWLLKNKQQNSKQSGNNQSGKLEGQFDKHCYENENENENKNEKFVFEDEFGEVGFDKDFNPAISPDAAEKMRKIAVSAAQAHERSRGKLPAGIKNLVGNLTKSEINWRERLCSFVCSIPNGNRTWLPPSRRRLWNNEYFQSRRGEKIKGVVAIDTSGSCIGDLPKFFSELKSLIESFQRYELTVLQIDADVSKVDEYDENNPLEFDENLVAHGGGGTSFQPCIDYLLDNGINPDFVCYLTDGYGDVQKNQPPWPFLWLITKDGNENFCDWGTKVKFKKSSWE